LSFAFSLNPFLRKQRKDLYRFIEFPQLTQNTRFLAVQPCRESEEFLKYISDTEEIVHIFIVGMTKKAGKSVLLEQFLTYYHDLGNSLTLDLFGLNFENCFYARAGYPVYLVYNPNHLELKNTNPNITLYEWYENFDWLTLFNKAFKERAIISIGCIVPDNPEFYKMFYDVLYFLRKVRTPYIRTVGIRELSSFMPRHGQLNIDNDKGLKKIKRMMLKLVRWGAHFQNRIIADTQRYTDVSASLTDNAFAIIYKRARKKSIETYLNEDIKELITKLNIDCGVIDIGGKPFGCRVRFNPWHKQRTESPEAIGLYAREIDTENHNNTYSIQQIPQSVQEPEYNITENGKQLVHLQTYTYQDYEFKTFYSLLPEYLNKRMNKLRATSKSKRYNFFEMFEKWLIEHQSYRALANQYPVCATQIGEDLRAIRQNLGYALEDVLTYILKKMGHTIEHKGENSHDPDVIDHTTKTVIEVKFRIDQKYTPHISDINKATFDYAKKKDYAVLLFIMSLSPPYIKTFTVKANSLRPANPEPWPIQPTSPVNHYT